MRTIDEDDDTKKQIVIKFYNNESIRIESIYLIGSFNNWTKKLKLEPVLDDGESIKYYKCLILLNFGIYKIKFLINNEIKYIENLPIATDESGNFLNWFEIKNDDEKLIEIDNLNIDKKITKLNESKSSVNLKIDNNYSQEIPEIFKLINNDEILSIDERLLNKNPIPDLPIYLNNNYLNKHFNLHHEITSNDNKYLNKGLNFHILPHVNLNHLLTSNIKNNVLGVACTTRYSGKFLTQIMYSPSDVDL